ncbi:MAG: aldehyde dehydrogenase family protein, partial [Pseudomonadales bacterium]|nr:aldehyde dehydrogenase family protein [Pseudomonadales bacterium]
IKKVFLELGGKSAHIVLDDADFGMGLLTGMAVCFHAGQGCAIPTRFLLPKSRYEEGVEILKSYLGGMKYGDPQSLNDMMSAVVSERQMNRILDYIEIGKKEGARLVLGGERDTNYPGYYIKPTIFADVSNDMTIAQEEIFGPVMCVIAYEDDEDAIRIANDSIYGLSGSVFSGDQDRALKMARRIRTGTMNINGSSFFAPDSPFGGYKQSGVGREMGVEGFEEYLEIKTVAIPAS